MKNMILIPFKNKLESILLSLLSIVKGGWRILKKNPFEFFILIMPAPTESSKFFGLKMLSEKAKDVHQKKPYLQERTDNHGTNRRRELLKVLAGIPFLAIFAGTFSRNREETGPDIVSRTKYGIKTKADFEQEKDLKVKLPAGKLGNLTVSKMILGCNLIGGWSHARDLIYTDELFKAYNNEEKIIETLYLAEKGGINTTLMVTQYYPTLNKYKRIYEGKIQSICQAMLPEKDFLSDINLAINSGSTALYIQGGEGDKYINAGKLDMIFKAIDYIKKQGYLAGMGAHSLETIKVCEREGIPADFYVKTLHHDRYWSAHPEENREEYSVIRNYSPDHNRYHDNMWDLFPSRTIEFMKTVNKPWIAFKVLAAGAIPPKDGFRYAFENGADFIAVGMFDFQILNDINITNQVLGSLGKRERRWYS
jgi:hypothetical protein